MDATLDTGLTFAAACRSTALACLMDERNACPRIAPVTGENLGDLDGLFSRGDPRWCQCAYFRRSSGDWSTSSPAENRVVLASVVAAAADAGRSAGLIAYRDGEPVGWVSFGPRAEFARLEASRLLARVDDKPVWSIVCFVVSAKARRQGIARSLLAAAVDYAREHGVRLLEAYPVDTGTNPTTSAALYKGTLSMFEQAGFRTVAVRQFNRATPKRPIVRKALRPKRSAPPVT